MWDSFSLARINGETEGERLRNRIDKLLDKIERLEEENRRLRSELECVREETKAKVERRWPSMLWDPEWC